MDVYRDARGRFAPERRAVIKQSGDRHFIWLFGKWAELKPVTAEIFRARTEQYFQAMQVALARTA